jgi:ribosome assembly protein RRB1
MKWDDMSKTVDEDNVDSSDDDSDENKKQYQEPEIRYESMPHKGAINRIRSMNNGPIVATWSEDAEVGIYDITPALEALEEPMTK